MAFNYPQPSLCHHHLQSALARMSRGRIDGRCTDPGMHVFSTGYPDWAEWRNRVLTVPLPGSPMDRSIQSDCRYKKRKKEKTPGHSRQHKGKGARVLNPAKGDETSCPPADTDRHSGSIHRTYKHTPLSMLIATTTAEYSTRMRDDESK